MKYYNKQGIELTCKVCGKNFKHLGAHLFHAHGILARDYKEEYGLPFKMSLISSEIYEKKVEAFEQERTKYLRNITKDNGHRFIKGTANFARRFSDYEKVHALERILQVNARRKGKSEACPVCKMTFSHVESHLYNAHGLLRVNTATLNTKLSNSKFNKTL